MSDPMEPGEPRAPRSVVRLVVPLLVVIALGSAVAWWLRPPAEPHRAPAPTPRPKTTAETPPPVAAAPVSPPKSRPKPASPDVDAVPAPAATPPPAPKATLHVSSDVDGAHVFVDRKYIGNTPVDTSEVTPGPHQVNVSAEGFDGVSERVDVAEVGSTDLHVSLKTVRLNVSVPVLHKHAMGSCEGTLHADPSGLRFDTPNTPDAFSMPLSELDVFSTDYAQKTLKVKRRGGRTWNFSTKAPTADALVSFQQAVDRARQKLGLRP